MKELHYKRAFYFPNGLEEITLIVDDQIDPKSLVQQMDVAITAIDKAKKEVRAQREKEVAESLEKDPKTRLESLKFQKLKLEEAVRTVSVEIMKLEEQMSDSGENG